MQGHVHLVLLPVLYNALAWSEQPAGLRDTPLFTALHGAMAASAYAPLCRCSALGPDPG